MLSWILQITIISIILIFLVHSLIQFFKDTLTIPKIKDLVNSPTKKYENMFLAMRHGKNSEYNRHYTNYGEDYKKSLLPSESTPIPEADFDVASMKNELKDYLKNQNLQNNGLIDGNSTTQEMDLNFINATQSTNW